MRLVYLAKAAVDHRPPWSQTGCAGGAAAWDNWKELRSGSDVAESKSYPRRTEGVSGPGGNHCGPRGQR